MFIDIHFIIITTIEICNTKHIPKCSGYSLLEILIALFILAFGVLSLVSANSMALRRAHDAYLSSLAIVEVANLQEAVQVGDSANYYNHDWRIKLAGILPDGKGSLNTSESGYQSSVCWTQHFAQYSTRCIELRGSK